MFLGDAMVEVLSFVVRHAVCALDQDNTPLIFMWSVLFFVVPLALALIAATKLSSWCVNLTGVNLGWMLVPILASFMVAGLLQLISGDSELCFTHTPELPPSMQRQAMAKQPWWVPRASEAADRMWPFDDGAPDVFATQGRFATDVSQLGKSEQRYSPMARAYAGVGRVWVGRGVIPQTIVSNWTLGAISASNAGPVMVTADLNAYEQDATEHGHARLRNIVSDAGVNFRNLHSGTETSGTPGVMVNEDQAASAYLSENAHLMTESSWLASNGDVVEELLLRTWIGRHADSRGIPKLLPPVVSLRYLWIGAEDSRSSSHSDPDQANVLVQLNGTKDVWIYRPDHGEWLGRLGKWDTGATLGAVGGFQVWDSPDGPDKRGGFAAGDVCKQMNRVALLEQGSVAASTHADDRFEACAVSPAAAAQLQSTAADTGAAPEEAMPASMPPVDASKGAIHVRLYPGDVLSIPTGWMHMARSRTDGVSLSIRPMSLCQALASWRLLWAQFMHTAGLLQAGDCTCHEPPSP
jgi:hypothetical protein